MHDAEAAATRIAQLKALGVLIAIDDFGTAPTCATTCL